MAVSNSETVTIPKWPAEPIDPEVARVSYDVVADEFLVYFGGKPVPKVSDPIDAPGMPHVNIMVGIGPDDEDTDEIVGVHVIPMMLGTIQEQPEWAVLVWAAMAGDYGTELLKERLPIFLDQVAEAFRTYWKPAPPIEEQLAALNRSRGERDGEGRIPRSA
jgi:hypothetical protein